MKVGEAKVDSAKLDAVKGGKEKNSVIKTHISVPTNPHPHPDSHSRRAHGTKVPYQGRTDTGINKGKSLLANHSKDGHTCADDFQPNQ